MLSCSESDNTRIVVRFRPDSSRETVLDFRRERDELDKGFIVEAEEGTVTGYYDLDRNFFSFDHVLAPEATQEAVYELAVLPSVADVFAGINSTVMVCTVFTSAIICRACSLKEPCVPPGLWTDRSWKKVHCGSRSPHMIVWIL